MFGGNKFSFSFLCCKNEKIKLYKPDTKTRECELMYLLEQVPFFPFTLYLLHPSAKLKSRFVDLLNAVFDNVHGRFHDHYFRDIGGQYIFCTKSKRKKHMKTFRLLDITTKKKPPRYGLIL